MRPAKPCNPLTVNDRLVCKDCGTIWSGPDATKDCGLVRDRTTRTAEIYCWFATAILIGLALIWTFGG